MLTLFDCVCIIMGTIIGAGIFKLPAVVAGNLPSVSMVVLVWIFGGFIALIGAICFAELTTTYPDRGGDYGYLKRAYHKRIGFAFSWAAFWVIRPGNIGAVAMIFGEFAAQIFPGGLSALSLALISVIVVSVVNLIGITFGKTTQNILTVAKVAGIFFIVIAAFFLSPQSENAATQSTSALSTTQADASAVDTQLEASEATKLAEPTATGNVDEEVTTKKVTEDAPSLWSAFWLSMVFVMFTFGGWNDIAFVATEVKNPKSNLFWALVFGTVTVLLIYLLVNFGLIFGVGFEKMQALGSRWENPTSYLITQRMGEFGNTLFAVLVCTSCLGSINAMIFTSPRIYSATARDYPALRWLASEGSNGWWRAMVLQLGVTLIFIATFTTATGSIENITAATAPYFWLFLALTVGSLMISRIKFAGNFEGYRVPLYPLPPMIFIAACGFMAYRAWGYMIEKDLLLATQLIGGWVILGIVLSFFMGSETADVDKDGNG